MFRRRGQVQVVGQDQELQQVVRAVVRESDQESPMARLERVAESVVALQLAVVDLRVDLAQVRDREQARESALVLEKARLMVAESALEKARLRESDLEMALDRERSKAMGKE